jgi:hypothetical protein
MSNFNRDMQVGAEFQDYITDRLFDFGISTNYYTSKKYQLEKAEGRSGIEVKFDSGYYNYNGDRVKSKYVVVEFAKEVRPKGSNVWEDTTLFKHNIWLFVIGNYDKAWALPVRKLRKLVKDDRVEKTIKHNEGNNDTRVKLMRLPIEIAENIAVFTIKKEEDFI